MSARPSSLLRAASALVVATVMVAPLAAQNPAPAAAPQAPMTCDSACHARMMMGQGGGMGGMGRGGMQGGMMMCPMMGQMHGAGGMQGMGGMGGMGGGMMMMHGMQGMGATGGGPGNMTVVRRIEMGGMPDTANMRQMAENHATMTRAYYDALVRRGFTPAQALQIVSAQGMPGPGR